MVGLRVEPLLIRRRDHWLDFGAIGIELVRLLRERGREDAQALHKLLSTQHQLISTKTGPQAGLPPTLISHSPFRHSKQSELTV